MEYNVLLGAINSVQEYSPMLYIEIHGADDYSKTENIRQIVEFLLSRRYEIMHVESHRQIDITNYQIANLENS